MPTFTSITPSSPPRQYKNISGRDQWIAFVPPRGRTVKAGSVFSVPYDLQALDTPNRTYPRPVEIFEMMLKKGIIAEHVEEAAPVTPMAEAVPVAEEAAPVHQEEPEVSNDAVTEDAVIKEPEVSNDAVTEDAPAVPEVADTEIRPPGKGKKQKKASDLSRALPVITPAITYSEETEQFTIDWAETGGLSPTDKFEVLVTGPDDKETKITADTERTITYNAVAGFGDYTFVVTVIDGNRTQPGVAIHQTVV